MIQKKKKVFTAIKIMAIGVTWLIKCKGGEGGAKSSVGVGNSNLLNCQVKDRGR